MTCCFQGRCHGNTEEDSKLDSANPEKKERCWRKEATEQKEGRVEAADIVLLMITSRAGESKGLFLKSGVIRVELLSQFEQCRILTV